MSKSIKDRRRIRVKRDIPIANAKRGKKLKAGGKAVNPGFIDFMRKMVANQATSRMALARFMQGEEQYDIDQECGYPSTVTADACKDMIEREGVALRVLKAFTDECWSVEPFVYETEAMPTKAQTKFEKALLKLYTDYGLYEKLHRADDISGIGRYGILVLGFNKTTDLSRPVCKMNKKGELEAVGGPYKLLWVMPYDETEAEIAKLDDNQSSYRYGQPLYYNLKLSDPSDLKAAKKQNTKVHWSRVIHIPDGCRSSDILGTPRLECVFNYLLNIRKISGGSAEMLWKGGFPGFSFEVPPELAGEVEWDKESLRSELEQYFSGMKRYISTEGLHANSLQPNIADPTPALTVQLLLISIALGIPQRMLSGTEEARLASVQDSESWNKKVHRRQNSQVSARILRPFIDRLIVTGVLPTPSKSEGKYFIHWPDLFSVSESDRAGIAQKLISALAEYETSGVSMIFPPIEFFTRILQFSTEEAEEILKSAEKEKKKMVKSGAIDSAGRPLPSKQEMQLQKAQMHVTLKRAQGAGGPSAKAKAANNPRSRAKGATQRAKTTGKVNR